MLASAGVTAFATLTQSTLSEAGTPSSSSAVGGVPPTLSVVSTPAAVIAKDSSPAMLLRKRSATELLQSESAKRSKGRKHSSFDSVALSMDRLAAAFTSDDPVTSPERKRQAIQLIEEDDDLSENECIRAYQFIRKDTAFADTVLAIRKKETRTRYIQHELNGDN